ncbi:hypothetical protein ABGB19_10610 [Mycobacterium sp. B14F4]|uniref:putative alpha/beta hydrolase n=1 Tax=Mycobacterium sp. B14F4 TaxID=3153565 RepID=UPI00325CDBEC
MSVLLNHLNVGSLVGAAGGDPWHLDKEIQSGSPGQIGELATAFHEAGVCTQETSDEFIAAKQRFESAWDRQDGGDHPINDSEEVRRATESLHLTREQMGRIAVDLQNISASLAEAQRSGEISIGNLDSALRMIDNQIDREIAIAAANGEAVDVSALEQAAVETVRQALQEVQAIRDAYSEKLDTSRLEMAAEGYSPEANTPVDGQGDDATNGQARAEAERYGMAQRATDEALVHSPGPWTPENQAAAGRLRDFATITNPTAGIDEVRHAGSRLNDYYLSQFQGPLPVDPVTGKTAAQRAAFRQEWQTKLEQGLVGRPLMSPDQATQFLNQQEALARDIVFRGAETRMRAAGISETGIADVLRDIAAGANTTGTGLERYGESVPTGKHALDGLSKADAELLSKAGFKLSTLGNVVQLGTAGWEWWYSEADDRHERLGEAAGSVGGSIVGGAAAGAAVGTVAGPLTAAGAAIVGGFLGGLGGGDIGGGLGGLFDKPFASGSGGKSW